MTETWGIGKGDHSQEACEHVGGGFIIELFAPLSYGTSFLLWWIFFSHKLAEGWTPKAGTRQNGDEDKVGFERRLHFLSQFGGCI